MSETKQEIEIEGKKVVVWEYGNYTVNGVDSRTIKNAVPEALNNIQPKVDEILANWKKLREEKEKKEQAERLVQRQKDNKKLLETVIPFIPKSDKDLTAEIQDNGYSNPSIKISKRYHIYNFTFH